MIAVRHDAYKTSGEWYLARFTGGFGLYQMISLRVYLAGFTNSFEHRIVPFAVVASTFT